MRVAKAVVALVNSAEALEQQNIALQLTKKKTHTDPAHTNTHTHTPQPNSKRK